MAGSPSEEELEMALEKLKSGKAGKESGILPEMLNAACEGKELLGLLIELVEYVWRDCRGPSDWCDAMLIPISKKGGRSVCVITGGGIGLLDVIGKVISEG